MRIIATTLLASSLALTGCTVNPATGEKRVNKAVVGVLAGAALGAAVDKNNRGRGAAIGAVVGGGAGLYMENQARKMEQQMAGSDVRVEFDKSTGTINLIMPGNITFDTNMSNIKTNFAPTLGKVANVMKEYKDTIITVSGHTDNKGSVALNQKLSEDRANSVARYLADNGVAADRLEAMGYAFKQPAASNDTEEGRATNRRVEITIRATQNAGT